VGEVDQLMLKRILLLGSWVLVNSAALKAQNVSSVPMLLYSTSDSCDLGCMLARKFSDGYSKKYADSCGSGVFFTRFRVDGDGGVQAISFSNGSPSVMMPFIQEVIQQTSGKWTPCSQGNCLLLQPVFFTFNRTCPQDVPRFYPIRTDSLGRKKAVEDKDVRNMNLLFNFMHLLDFGNSPPGKTHTLNPQLSPAAYIILQPAFVKLPAREGKYLLVP
jgi:hypothetical protein